MQMFKIKILISVIFILLVGGCDNFFKKIKTPNYTAQENIKEATSQISNETSNIEKSTEIIDKTAQNIREEAVEAQTKLPLETRPIISPHLETIKDGSNKIIEENTNIQNATIKIVSAKELLKDANLKIETMVGDIKQLEDEKEKALKERDKAIEEKNSQLHKMLRYIIVGCLAGTVLFAIAFFMYGNSKGLIGAGVCAAVMAVAIFVDTYLKYLILAGGGIFALLVGLLIYNIYKQRKAFFEVVDTVEVAQDNMPEETKNAVFGGPGEVGIMNAIQSSDTMQMVKDAKKKMSALWYYAKVHKPTTANVKKVNSKSSSSSGISCETDSSSTLK